MKKFLYISLIPISAAIFPFIASAQSFNASDTITLPPNFIDLLWQEAGLVFNSLSTYTTTIIGVLLAIVLVETLIILLRRPGQH